MIIEFSQSSYAGALLSLAKNYFSYLPTGKCKIASKIKDIYQINQTNPIYRIKDHSRYLVSVLDAKNIEKWVQFYGTPYIILSIDQ